MEVRMLGKLLPVATLAALLCARAAPAFAATDNQGHIKAATKIAKKLLASGQRRMGDFAGTHAYTGYYGEHGEQHNSLWVTRKLRTATTYSRFDLPTPGAPKTPDGMLRHAATRVEPAQKATPTKVKVVLREAPATPEAPVVHAATTPVPAVPSGSAPSEKPNITSWAKERALRVLATGDAKEAVRSMVADLMKDPKNDQRGFMLMMMGRASEGSVEAARSFIEGFRE
jgi:hypothetical protein